ncbi:MAG TPA: LptF/LptG family permease, partial [Chitinophagaceae bacterium]
YNLQDNFMVAESGIMRITPDQRFLEFELHNGWNYQEDGSHFTTNTQYIRLGFKTYKKEFDLSTFKLNRTEDSLFKYDAKMLSLPQLKKAIDSLGDVNATFYKRTKRELNPYVAFIKYADSSWPPVQKITLKKVKSFDDVIPDSLKTVVFDRSLSIINNSKSTIELLSNDYYSKVQMVRKHWVEWHRKIALSAACIVLFMIGAPLGSIIRKGGLGTPLIFAIAFFVLFNMLNTFGEKFAKQGVTSVFEGMWLSTLILIPIGIFLTYKAMRDSQLFNKEFYFRLFRRRNFDKS